MQQTSSPTAQARPPQPHPGGAHPVLGLLGWLALSTLVAVVGARASVSAATFYGQLSLPAWAPPAGLFGPVWTVLYAMMAVAAWRVWRRGGWSKAAPALSLYVVQLVANGLWSWLFFGWRLGGWALVDLVVLWVLIVATLVAFARWSRLAAWLLVPYLAWVSFAGVLNYTLWRGNPGLL